MNAGGVPEVIRSLLEGPTTKTTIFCDLVLNMIFSMFGAYKKTESNGLEVYTVDYSKVDIPLLKQASHWDIHLHPKPHHHYPNKKPCIMHAGGGLAMRHHYPHRS